MADMSRPLRYVMLVLTLAGSVHAQSSIASREGEQSVTVGRYRLQSNPWVNLHQRLYHEARVEPAPPPAGLSDEELAKWKRAVDDYHAFIGKRDSLADDELIAINAELSATRSDQLPDSIPAAASAVLKAAMPLYRVAQWEQDDRANRFWIAVVQPMLASAGDELAEAHAKVYGYPFPTDVLVDVACFAGEFGAYTVRQGKSAHVTLESTDSGIQGFAALEILLHEPSHVIVRERSGAIGADLVKIGNDLNIKPPYNLWHAILFYTSGELTRRTLARRGVTNYHPIVLDMYARGFRGFKQPLETHWQAYLDGKVSREEALRQILIETVPTPK